MTHEWNKWKNTLRSAVNIGEAIGMSEDTMANVGKKVGDFLSNNADIDNPENRILKELWDKGDDSEKQALTRMIVRMVDED